MDSSILSCVLTQSAELPKDVLKGTVTAHPKGFGFVTCEDLQEFFVPPAEMRRVVPGDLITFTVQAGKAPDSFQAKVRAVLARPSTTWQGVLVRKDDRMVLRPDADTPCFAQLVLAPALIFSAEETVVSVRVAGFTQRGKGQAPSPDVPVQLERILGPREREGFVQDYALARHDFPLEFSAAALREAATVAARPISFEGRADLRSLALTTIDGESTRDYDDAVHAQAKPGGGWTVVVAIADVSAYVLPGGVLDKEAQARGTSVYLPGKLLPMLPESLSTDACSLLENQDRLAVALELDVREDGELAGSRVFRAVVRSQMRLTYAEVQAWREGTFRAPASVSSSLQALWAVHAALAQCRQAKGRVETEAPEPRLIRDEDGQARLAWIYRTDAHRLVEELMLLANRAVAHRLAQTAAGVFRHQATPDSLKWDKVCSFAQSRGLSLPESPSLPALAQLVRDAQALNPEDKLKAELHVRNSMSPAQYSDSEPGHFSLNMPAYTHFTSPIRRYADLLVHRLLLEPQSMALSDIAVLTAKCSNRSRAARLAERQVWDFYKKTALWTALGAGNEPLPGHVVNQSKNGVRVVADEWQTSLLLDAKHLRASGFQFDLESGNWGSSERVLELGSALEVVVSGCEKEDSKFELRARLSNQA